MLKKIVFLSLFFLCIIFLIFLGITIVIKLNLDMVNYIPPQIQDFYYTVSGNKRTYVEVAPNLINKNKFSIELRGIVEQFNGVIITLNSEGKQKLIPIDNNTEFFCMPKYYTQADGSQVPYSSMYLDFSKFKGKINQSPSDKTFPKEGNTILAIIQTEDPKINETTNSYPAAQLIVIFDCLIKNK
jgi:hypothetical protein